MTYNDLNKGGRSNIIRQAAAFGIKGQQVLDVISLTRSAIKEELHIEWKNGRYKPILQFLLDNSVRHGKNILFDKVIQKVAGRLMLRLGIPGGLAVSIATLLVPILWKGLSKKASKNVNLQNLLTRLDTRNRLADLAVVKKLFQKKDQGPETA